MEIVLLVGGPFVIGGIIGAIVFALTRGRMGRLLPAIISVPIASLISAVVVLTILNSANSRSGSPSDALNYIWLAVLIISTPSAALGAAIFGAGLGSQVSRRE